MKSCHILDEKLIARKKLQDLEEKFRKINHKIKIKKVELIDLIRSYDKILPNSLDSCNNYWCLSAGRSKSENFKKYLD